MTETLWVVGGEQRVQFSKPKEWTQYRKAVVVEVSAVFPYVGSEPQTSLVAPHVALDPEGRVPTDAWMRTERRGLIVAGEARSESAAQAVTVAGDGATAAIAAARYLATGAWASVETSVAS